jgi:hypothetical protein
MPVKTATLDFTVHTAHRRVKNCAVTSVQNSLPVTANRLGIS